jgi:hypothetical protein
MNCSVEDATVVEDDRDDWNSSDAYLLACYLVVTDAEGDGHVHD